MTSYKVHSKSLSVSKGKILQNFVAFSEYMNFKIYILAEKVNVFFRRFVVSQFVKTCDEFIIGGSMSLYLGITFISAFELLELLVRMMASILKPKSKKVKWGWHGKSHFKLNSLSMDVAKIMFCRFYNLQVLNLKYVVIYKPWTQPIFSCNP